MIAFSNSLPMILHRTLDAVMPRYREVCAEADLTEQQWRILRVLWSEKKVTSARLAEQALIPPPSLVGILDRLEKRGLVVRTRSKQDRRLVHVLLTPLGKSLEKEVAPHVADINAEIFDIVSQEDWDTMQRTLETIAAHMKRSKLDKAASG